MFCPKCSRRQIAENVRFCSGCGFQLNVVKALLGVDGGEESSSKSPEFAVAALRSHRKRDMTIGAVLMMFFALHSAWTTEDLSLEREYTSLIVKCLILCVLIKTAPFISDFFSGILSAREDGSSSPKMLARLAAKFKNKDQNSALPTDAFDSRPAVDYFSGRQKNGEFIAAPPSVTEDTTNLLRNN